jgi:hypothetical protein
MELCLERKKKQNIPPSLVPRDVVVGHFRMLVVMEWSLSSSSVDRGVDVGDDVVWWWWSTLVVGIDSDVVLGVVITICGGSRSVVGSGPVVERKWRRRLRRHWHAVTRDRDQTRMGFFDPPNPSYPVPVPIKTHTHTEGYGF